MRDTVQCAHDLDPAVLNHTVTHAGTQPPDENVRENKPVSEHTFKAWSTVAGSFLVYFVAFGYMNSFGFFQNYYELSDLANFPSSVIALIGSLQIGLMYIIGPVAGALFDAYGHKWLYLAGIVGALISCLGLSFAERGHIWQYFLSQGLLFGLTVSFGTTVALAISGQHFEQHRALAMGTVAAGSSAGGVCFPIMFSRLVPRIGFKWTVRVVPLIFLFCYGIAIIISRPKLARQPLRSIKEAVDFRGFRDTRYTLLALATVIGNLGLYVPYNYAEPYFRLFHHGSPVGSYLLPIINASSFFGRAIGGFIADEIGVLNLLCPVTIICGISSLAMWLNAESVGFIIAFVSLYGFCSGIYISIIPSIVVRISPEEKVGARLGAFFSLGSIGVFTGTPIGGAFLSQGTVKEFHNVIIFAGVCMTSAGFLFLGSRYVCDRNLRAKW